MLLQTVSISAVPPCLIWCIATVELKEDVFVFEQEKKIVYNWKKSGGSLSGKAESRNSSLFIRPLLISAPVPPSLFLFPLMYPLL